LNRIELYLISRYRIENRKFEHDFSTFERKFINSPKQIENPPVHCGIICIKKAEELIFGTSFSNDDVSLEKYRTEVLQKIILFQIPQIIPHQNQNEIDVLTIQIFEIFPFDPLFECSKLKS